MINLRLSQRTVDIGEALNSVAEDPETKLRAILIFIRQDDVLGETTAYAEAYMDLTPEDIKPITKRYAPIYLKAVTDSKQETISWHKARLKEEEAELKKLIKLKEKYK